MPSDFDIVPPRLLVFVFALKSQVLIKVFARLKHTLTHPVPFSSSLLLVPRGDSLQPESEEVSYYYNV